MERQTTTKIPGPCFQGHTLTLFGETGANQVSARMKKKGVLWEDPALALVGTVCMQGGEHVSSESFLEKLAFVGAAHDICSGASYRVNAVDPSTRRSQTGHHAHWSLSLSSSILSSGQSLLTFTFHLTLSSQQSSHISLSAHNIVANVK